MTPHSPQSLTAGHNHNKMLPCKQTVHCGGDTTIEVSTKPGAF
jgi:hypothetical protein